MLDYDNIKNCYRLIAVDLSWQNKLDADLEVIQQIDFVRQSKHAGGKKKLESAAKIKTGTTLRITKKNFQDEQLPHELFLRTRQKTKIRNAFTKNILMDVKLSKVQLYNCQFTIVNQEDFLVHC